MSAIPNLKLSDQPLELEVHPIELEVHPIELEVHPIELEVHPIELDVQPIELDVQPIELEVHPIELDVQPIELDVQPIELDVQPSELPELKPLQKPLQKSEQKLEQKGASDTFDSFAFPESITQSLKDMGISCPTPVQAATIAIAIEGQDVMASAQTGTGKTLAYTIPLMVRLLASPHSNALVLAPTRELAAQVRDVLRQLLGRRPSFNMALLIGGESMGKQFAQLKGRPRIIVGTPGRICDHLNRGSLSLKNTGFLVIDEADRMLDMGFSIQLDEIAKFLPKDRQTLMFSATMPGNIIKLSQKYLQDPARVSVDSTTKAAPKIKQEIIRTTPGDKFPNLLRELNEREGSVIVFVKTKRGADQLAEKLRKQDLSADSIHGDLKQRQRDRAILHFRNSRTRIMVATDVAARGLDIPHIRHVINYDLPQCPEDYIHRIGRTARAGSEGNALCLICPDDNAKWNAINRLMNPGAPKEPANQGGGRSGPKSYRGRSGSGRVQATGESRSDFPRRKEGTGGGFGKSTGKTWGKPRREGDQPSSNSSGKSWGKPGTESSGNSWGGPRTDSSGAADWKSSWKSGGKAEGQSSDRRSPVNASGGKTWTPRGESTGAPGRKPAGKTWGQPRSDASGGQPPRKPWGGGNNKPSGFNPSGAKKGPNKRFSRGA
ncbi:MAG: DEAD/DEAH box helicase [Alphaproteobacteria bacterium]|jgi:ATP-dependent RNA helicase DeaD|nr:DEAD/DEAH box helicase [Alphaproteobacteria bacterium]